MQRRAVFCVIHMRAGEEVLHSLRQATGSSPLQQRLQRGGVEALAGEVEQEPLAFHRQAGVATSGVGEEFSGNRGTKADGVCGKALGQFRGERSGQVHAR
jgi:hypothetical protein